MFFRLIFAVQRRFSDEDQTVELRVSMLMQPHDTLDINKINNVSSSDNNNNRVNNEMLGREVFAVLM